MYVFILKYVIIALCLAYMNHVFSKKKAVMYDVKRHILEKRLEIYASLHKLFLRNSTLIAPPAIKEQYYWSLMNGMPFRIGDQKWSMYLISILIRSYMIIIYFFKEVCQSQFFAKKYK